MIDNNTHRLDTEDKFATDATFLPELTDQLRHTGQLAGTRQAAFLAQTGTPMGEDNVWLAGRRTEQNALRAIITELENNPHAAGPQAIRGAGTTARTDALIAAKQEPR